MKRGGRLQVRVSGAAERRTSNGDFQVHGVAVGGSAEVSAPVTRSARPRGSIRTGGAWGGALAKDGAPQWLVWEHIAGVTTSHTHQKHTQV